MQQRRHNDTPAPLGADAGLSERYLKTVTGAALWFVTTGIIVAASFVPAIAPDNAGFWRVVLGVPAILLGLAICLIGPKLSSRAFQLYIELNMIPALGVNLFLLRLTPATIAVLFNMLATLIYAGYFLRRPALALTLAGGVGIALSTLFTASTKDTPHLASYLVVYIPAFVMTALLLHVQNDETLQALHRTRRRALTDPLTGLANLRALERDAVKRFNRRGKPAPDVTALLLIDLDNFKSANTRHGHLGGDYALRMIARQLIRVAPRDAIVARVGGDEFAVLTSASSRERAVEVGAIFRGGVRAAASVMDLPGLEIDAAVGCAVFPDDGRDLGALLDTADRSMYAQKGEKKHAHPVLEAVDQEGPAPPSWVEIREVPIKERASASLDMLTGGNHPFFASHSLYARTSALAWAIGSIVLGVSMAMPDAPNGVLPWWFILFGGLALSVRIFFVNAQSQSRLHVIFDFIATISMGLLIGLTGGLESTVPPLLVLLVASQAWFWNTRYVTVRVIGPVLVALSPLLYDSIGGQPESWVTLVTLFAESAMIVALVLAMYYDRVLLTALLERADALAMTDPLTGIANRRAFDARVVEELEAGNDFAIVMLDLDNFKQVNTTRGHRAGDAVLRAIAAELKSVSRDDDCIARVGGDEFGAVLSGVGVDGARLLAERFVAAVSACDEAREGDVGASAGFALHPLHGETLDELVFTADNALMSVKASGKGTARVARVVSAAG